MKYIIVLLLYSSISFAGEASFKMELYKVSPVTSSTDNYVQWLDSLAIGTIKRKISAPEGYETIAEHPYVYGFNGHKIEFTQVIPRGANKSNQNLSRAVIRLNQKVNFLRDMIHGALVYKIVRVVSVSLRCDNNFSVTCCDHGKCLLKEVYLKCLAKEQAYSNQLSEAVFRFTLEN